MARITVDDCLSNITNRFQLVLLAAKRARQLAMSSTEPTVVRRNDKPTVIALREIAEGNLNLSLLSEDDEETAPTTQMPAAETLGEAPEAPTAPAADTE